MNLVGWILSGGLAAIFLAVGLAKIATPRDKLVTTPHMEYVEDFSSGQMKAIGTIEVLGALGVILPWITGIAEILGPIAALGLAVVMACAMAVHARRQELKAAWPVNLGLMALAVVVAIIQFTAL